MRILLDDFDEADQLREVETDGRGRAYLGTDVADSEVKVALVEVNELDDSE